MSSADIHSFVVHSDECRWFIPLTKLDLCWTLVGTVGKSDLFFSNSHQVFKTKSTTNINNVQCIIVSFAPCLLWHTFSVQVDMYVYYVCH